MMMRKARILLELLVLTAVLAACSGANAAQTNATQPSPTAQAQYLIPLTAAQAMPTTAAAQPLTTLPAASQAPTLASPGAAAACTPPAALTPAETEGPYFKAGSPALTSLLAPGVTGTALSLSGYVLTQDCKPVANVLLDFWQANAQGQYDNAGYTLRGHQYTDGSGRYQLETIVPGLYPGRTLHIHVKVQAPNGPILTTQLYFPGIQQNDADSIFDPKMVINVQDTSSGLLGSFNFVISLK